MAGGMCTFNVNDGYVEAILRGFRGAILKSHDYHNLVQCETLQGIFRTSFWNSLFESV